MSEYLAPHIHADFENNPDGTFNFVIRICNIRNADEASTVAYSLRGPVNAALGEIYGVNGQTVH